MEESCTSGKNGPSTDSPTLIIQGTATELPLLIRRISMNLNRDNLENSKSQNQVITELDFAECQAVEFSNIEDEIDVSQKQNANKLPLNAAVIKKINDRLKSDRVTSHTKSQDTSKGKGVVSSCIQGKAGPRPPMSAHDFHQELEAICHHLTVSTKSIQQTSTREGDNMQINVRDWSVLTLSVDRLRGLMTRKVQMDYKEPPLKRRKLIKATKSKF
ncbi:hypothetical protein HDE_03338 [Halotydeus destructor]|nr:hypothetical protein HDE_03338 [Halotydeus destructor]